MLVFIAESLIAVMMPTVLIVLFGGFVSHCCGATTADDASSNDICEETAKASTLLQSRSKVVRDETVDTSLDTPGDACRLFEEDVSLEGHKEVTRWACEDDNLMREIIGLTPVWLAENQAKLASHCEKTLKVSGLVIGTGTVTVPSGANPVVEVDCSNAVALMDVTKVTEDEPNPNIPMEGEKTVLVLRVVALDAESTQNLDEISDGVFWHFGRHRQFERAL